jgi:ribosome biogenesis GTPase
VTTEAPSPLASLGWDATWVAAFAAARDALAIRDADDVTPARVVAEHRGRYGVVSEAGDGYGVLAGRARHETERREDRPAVGDWVGLTRASADGVALVRFVVPRRTAFVRKVAGETTEAQVVAANVDVALVATALPGDLSARRLDRYLTLAWESGATPVVLLTKSDLSSDPRAAVAEVSLGTPGAAVVAVSALTGDGIADLMAHLIRGRTAVLLGSSGVGKSTLVNRLLGTERQRTAELSELGKGRHTTTHRELIRLANGALLIDTPGMRELQLWNADEGLESAFADVEAVAEGCRFRDCAHVTEPGCAVREAVESGALSAERLEHWHRLKRELAYLDRKQDELATAQLRARVKAINRNLRDYMRRKYGDA